MNDVREPFVQPSTTALAYCTNVHQGATLEDNLRQLRRHAVEVRQRLDLDTLPIGWWLAEPALAELESQGNDGRDRLRDWLAERGLRVVTMNAFPFGDFHGRQVKHRVYLPDWSTTERRDYTLRLATLLAHLEPGRSSASISTVPIGWPMQPDPAPTIHAAADRLVEAASVLAELRERTGVAVHVDLEPEPGCLLQRSADVVAFFERALLPAAVRQGVSAETVSEFIGVCHDVCHAAVMFEGQARCLTNYADAGIRVGKVQVSSAIEARFAPDDAPGAARTVRRLRAFAEDRYLHQTMMRGDDGALAFYEDLPEALATVDAGRVPSGAWRTHFHVPVFLECADGADRSRAPATLGQDGLPDAPCLFTTHDQVDEALGSVRRLGFDPAIEVETYAWGVLPESLQPDSLAEGIAEELRWTAGRLKASGWSTQLMA